MPYPFEIKHHHGAMSVPNLEESIAWYTTMLDFQVESVVKLAHVPAKVAMLRRGDLRIELFEVPNATPLPPERRIPDEDLRTHGNKHIAFAVRDIDVAAEELRRRGVDIVFVKKFEFAAVAFIRDNSGNLIELLQQPDLWS